ncbi:MAG: epoxyqueuosine reductase QueH [Dehalococcoidales bacterium]|nr:epoxyqueuosine reductase QueH [Dehalococcoidales bacterium]
MKVLLHICCGVCGAGAIERLTNEGHQVTGYFFNPNIYPAEEYRRRLDAVKTVTDLMKCPFEEALYDPGEWLEKTADLAEEPEGGKRCEVCFRMRLEKTFLYMLENGFDAFATTLTIGPQKSAEVINRIGRGIGGDKFLARDFKKQNGFLYANEFAKRFGIYRQHYCGCIYSMRDK